MRGSECPSDGWGLAPPRTRSRSRSSLPLGPPHSPSFSSSVTWLFPSRRIFGLFPAWTCVLRTLSHVRLGGHTQTRVSHELPPGGRAAGPGSVGTRGQRSMPMRAGATWGPWGEGGLIFKGFNPFMTCPCLNAQRTRYTCRSGDLGQRRARPTWAHPQGTLPEPHFCLIQKSHTCVSTRFPR